MSLVGLISALVTLAASVAALAGLYCLRRPSHRFELFLVTWVVGLLAGEFALHWLFAVIGLTVLTVALGGLGNPVGWLAIAASIPAAAGMLQQVRLALGARRQIAEATDGVAAPGRGLRFPLSHVLFPPLFVRRRGVAKVRNIVFSEHGPIKLKLDIYRPKRAKAGDRRPAIVQVHGGGWIAGTRKEQGIALLNHLAAAGWVGFAIEYRRSPIATYPDHVVDVKAAIAWIREHAAEYGVDPEFIAITGGSAGGHLCALAALSANDPELQPGFEQADTSVAAAVPFYGLYDMTDPDKVQWRYLGPWVIEPLVFKKSASEHADLFEKASPTHLCHADAPPCLIIHGAKDSLTSPLDARSFAKRMAQTCENPVFHAELAGAQHAFDLFPSLRTAGVVRAVERFLAGVYTAHLTDRDKQLTEREGEVQSNVGVSA